MISQLSFLHLLLVIQLFALFMVWYLIVRDYQRDTFRQQVFALRDEIFDYVGACHIPYDDPAPKWLRHLLNGAIRFSHRIDFVSLAFASFVLKRYGHGSFGNPDADFNKMLAELDDEQVKSTLSGFRDRFKPIVGKYIVKTSFIMMALFAIAVISILVRLASARKDPAPPRTKEEFLASMLNRDRLDITGAAEECSYMSGTEQHQPHAALSGC